MYAVAAAVALLVSCAAGAAVEGEQRTLGDVSALTQLLSPSSGGPSLTSSYGLPSDSYSNPDSYSHSDSYSAPEHQDTHTPQGFTVQSGYEGVIIPSEPTPDHSILHRLGGLALGAGLIHHILPFPFNHIVLFLGSKLGLWVLGIGLFLLVGGAATTAICAFTPICTISFLGFRNFPFSRENVRSVINQDRLNNITQFVYDAIDKYQQLQKEGVSERTAKKAKYNKVKNAAPLAVEGRSVDLKERREVEEIVETNKLQAESTTEKKRR